MVSVAEFIKGIELGQAQSYHNMTVYPIRLKNAVADMGILTFDEAKDVVDIVEVDGGGDVPFLRAINRGVFPVLLPEGAIVVGNKQDRVVISTIVLNKQSEMNIHCRCVEHHRWQVSTGKASKSKHHLYASLRKKSYTSKANQGMIWKDIDAKGRKMGSRSRTGTANALYRGYEKELAAYSKSFRIGDSDNGMIIAIDNVVVGLELFGISGIFQKQFEGMLSSYALDAIDKELPRHILTVSQFLAQIDSAKQCNEDSGVALTSDVVEGKAYQYEGNLIHLAVFAI